MKELLSKIGIPATVASAVALLFTHAPLIFKIDERYTKQDEFLSELNRIEKNINILSVEVGKLAGTQQVMTSVLTSYLTKNANLQQSSNKKSLLDLPQMLPQENPILSSDYDLKLRNINRSLADIQSNINNLNLQKNAE